jgi:hypothetical protein
VFPSPSRNQLLCEVLRPFHRIDVQHSCRFPNATRELRAVALCASGRPLDQATLVPDISWRGLVSSGVLYGRIWRQPARVPVLSLRRRSNQLGPIEPMRGAHPTHDSSGRSWRAVATLLRLQRSAMQLSFTRNRAAAFANAALSCNAGALRIGFPELSVKLTCYRRRRRRWFAGGRSTRGRGCRHSPARAGRRPSPKHSTTVCAPPSLSSRWLGYRVRSARSRF